MLMMNEVIMIMVVRQTLVVAREQSEKEGAATDEELSTKLKK